MTVYKRGGSWIVDFWYDGKRYVQGVGKVTKSVAKEKEKILYNDAARGTYKPKTIKVLFKDFAEKYLEHAKLNKKPRSAKRNAFAIDRLKPFFGEKQLDEISPFMVEQYKKKRREEGRAAATVNREIETLRNLMNKAVEWGKLKVNPIARLRRFKEPTEKMWPLTPTEEEKLLAECAKRPQREKYLPDLVLFALNSGMRQEEIFNLKKTDVNFRAGIVLVADSKSGKPRKVPMNDTLREILKRRCAREGSEHVFCNEYGKRLTVLTNAFWYAVEKAGLSVRKVIDGEERLIKRFRFHDLRHTFGTRLGMAGYDTKTIMELMGHSTYRMAMAYQHPAPEHKLAAVKSLDRLTVKITTPDKEAAKKIKKTD